jgi:hypothetical protein
MDASRSDSTASFRQTSPLALVSLIVTFHLSVVVVGGGAGGVGTGEGGTGVGAVGERPHPTIAADDNRIASRTTHRTVGFRAFVVVCIECLHMTDPQIEGRDTAAISSSWTLVDRIKASTIPIAGAASTVVSRSAPSVMGE